MATPTPYDQASRYLVKMTPHDNLAWLLGVPKAEIRFHGWIDSKLPENLGYPDRMTDTLAELDNLMDISPLWAIVLEYQSYVDSEMPYRVTDYSNKVEWKCRPNKNWGDRYFVGSIVINLRGIEYPRHPYQWTKAGFLVTRTYRIINIETLNASAIMQDITAGRVPKALLGFVPLMKGGCEPAIIEAWLKEVRAIESSQTRADFGYIAKLFAECVGTPELWHKALEGWNMVESKLLNELTSEKVQKENQKFVIKTMKKRFGDSPSHETKIRTITDLERLDRMQDALLTVSSWDEIIAVE